MAQYPKTTGDLVTAKIKVASAANQGRMKLDDLLKEMFNIMLPVAELKTMMSDEVDAWIEKMAEYGQEWCEPDGRLLKCTDYPELFALIGYNYGWSNTNPNGTTTYSFTDNNGTAKSLVLYNDLDIDGNALAVSGTPAYFRIPNLAGRFLRCAGTASYVNKWTDTDGTVRQLLTEYKAEMYKGQLDAQRGIRGDFEFVSQRPSIQNGAFSNLEYIQQSAGGINGGNAFVNGWGSIRPKFNSSLVVPISQESKPFTLSILCLLRIKWGINGKANNIRESNQSSPDNFSGAFSKTFATGWPNVVTGQIDGAWAGGIEFSSSRVIPVQEEMVPIGVVATCLLRIAWGIYGRHKPQMYLTDLDEFGVDGTGTGCFGKMEAMGDGHYWGSFQSNGDIKYHIDLVFESSLVTPTGAEDRPLHMPVSALLRIAWAGNWVECVLADLRLL